MDNVKEMLESDERVRHTLADKKTQKGLLTGDDLRGKRGALIYNLLFLAVGVVFSRCHFLFGAHPLGIAYIAVLPVGVFPAAIGVLLGSLTMGMDGILYAVSAALTVFLRVIISGIGAGAQNLFSETLILRMSSATIAGFVGSVYEILMRGFSETTLLFGLTLVLIPPIIAFLFSGIFGTGIGLSNLLYGTGNIFSFAKKKKREKYNLVFFQISSLVILFFLSLSLAEYDVFGISIAYVFVSMITLLVARRLGPLRALAVGFVSALGLSGVDAVGFALAGLSSGILFNFNLPFGIAGGIAAICAWGAYSSGMAGFLATMPEFVISSVISIPILKNIMCERSSEEADESERSAAEMVGTMALTYRSKYTENLDALEESLISLSSVIRKQTPSRIELSHEEYKNIVLAVSDRFCKSCPDLKICERQFINPCRENADALADKLIAGELILAEDVNTDRDFCRLSKSIADELMHEAARAECESFRRRESNKTAEEYELIATLLAEAREADECERALDSALSEKLTAALCEEGYADWVIRAFGDRHKHFIIAGEDKDGLRIVAPELRSSIEKCAGVKLGGAEFFRKGAMALMECGIRRSYYADCASATVAGDRSEVSGDTVSAFESESGKFYALISDGMGRGEIARMTSEFVSEFLAKALNLGASKDTVLHLLNRAMRHGREECSATVDLFELDLYSKEALFIKSGSAPSYIVRESSIFRIKSQTAPLGLMSSIDTEKIRVEVRPGDTVILLSDGISQSSDDAPWLLELLSQPIKKDTPKLLADRILTTARARNTSKDDMSVLVVKIGECE